MTDDELLDSLAIAGVAGDDETGPGLVRALIARDGVTELLLRWAPDRGLVAQTFVASWMADNPEAHPLLLTLASRLEGDASVPFLRSVSRVPGDDAERLALSRLDSPNQNVAAAAVRILGSATSRESEAAILRMLKHRMPAVRSEAVHSLELRMGKDCLRHVAKLARDRDADVRLEVTGVLGKSGDDRYARMLERMISDDDAEVRGSALASLFRVAPERGERMAQKYAHARCMILRQAAHNILTKRDFRLG
jgi:HEAT repeat protein